MCSPYLHNKSTKPCYIVSYLDDTLILFLHKSIAIVFFPPPCRGKFIVTTVNINKLCKEEQITMQTDKMNGNFWQIPSTYRCLSQVGPKNVDDRKSSTDLKKSNLLFIYIY